MDSGKQVAKKEIPPTPPGNSHEYQNKRVTKFAIRKELILKRMFLVDQKEQERKRQP
jgi:hypothetical protein